MTDKEIIKALGCCTDYHFGGCDNCSYKATSKIVCHSGVMRDALDLINRQQAEIEKYRQTVGTLAEKNGEVVGLLNGKKTKYIKKDVAEIFKNIAVNMARTEAIKEFAERLKEAPIKCSYPLFGLSTKDEITEHFNDIMMQVRDAIDTIAKEMTGGAQ